MTLQTRRTPARSSHVPEYATEAVIIGASLGLYGFVKLTDEVTDGETRGFDRDIPSRFFLKSGAG